MTTELGGGRPGGPRAGGQQAAVPTPACIRAKRAAAVPAQRQAPVVPLAPGSPLPSASPGSASPRSASPRSGSPGSGSPDSGLAGPARLAVPCESAGLAGRPSAVPGSSGRVSARSALFAALSGVRLGTHDRQFLTRLVHWDKRNAASVASLVWRARQAGRAEGALTPRQLEVVMSALSDAAAYRGSGRVTVSRWDFDLFPGDGRCGEQTGNSDRARAYAEVAAQLGEMPRPSGTALVPVTAALPGPTHEQERHDVGGESPGGLPGGLARYRRRASVAS